MKVDRNELERVSRLLSDVRRRHFVVARGILRVILGSYLNIRPEEVKFRYGPHGKPFQANDCEEEARLRFSLSHSGRLALYAFTRGREIGVDLEYMTNPREIEIYAKEDLDPNMGRGLASGNRRRHGRLSGVYSACRSKGSYYWSLAVLTGG